MNSLLDLTSTKYVAGKEVVVTLDHAEILGSIAQHERHLCGNNWHGDIFEIELAFSISALKVQPSFSRSDIIEAVKEFVKYAQERVPQGKEQGITATVDSEFFEAFEEVGFKRVCSFECHSGELVATMHMMWPEPLTDEDMTRLRDRTFGGAAISQCKGCGHVDFMESDTPQNTNTCNNCRPSSTS